MTLPHPRSITLRITLLFSTVSTAVLLALGLLVGALVDAHFEELDAMQLDGRMHFLHHVLGHVRDQHDVDGLVRALDDAFTGEHGMAVMVRTPDGKAWYATPDAEFPPRHTGQHEHASSRPVRWTDAAGVSRRGIATVIDTAFSDAPRVEVAVSTDLAHHDAFMRSFRFTLWSVVGVAALVSGLLGWAAARSGLAPLRRIARDAAGITATRLDQRLSDDAIPLELAEVARTLNDMLARLEASFRRLSDFSSDLAHELRTPVNTLLTQTQVTLSRARSLVEYQDVLASNAEEFERLSRTIADMLFLAKADNDLLVPNREPVNLAAEVASLFEYYDAWADERRITLASHGEAAVTGDRLMLRRALGNLLSNAVRHTPPDGRVEVFIAATDNGATTVTVRNTGEAIAQEHLARIFDRFWRADASRHRDSDGAGLGLAITRSIVRAHGGEVTAASSHGATVFEIRLPRDTADSAEH